MLKTLFRRRPLYFYIGITVLLPMMLVYIASFIISYRFSYASELNQQHTTFSNAVDSFRYALDSKISSAKSGLKLLRHTHIGNLNDPDERENSLMQFDAYLKDNPNVYALFIGNQEGEFLQFSGHTEWPSMTLTVPKNTRRYLLYSTADGKIEREQFLDSTMNTLGQHSPTITLDPYDPSTRKWYQDAIAQRHPDSVVQSSATPFFGENKLGITISAEMTQSTMVIGASFTLDSFTKILEQLPRPLNSTLMMFEDEKLLYADKKFLDDLDIKITDSVHTSSHPLLTGVQKFFNENNPLTKVEERIYDLGEHGEWIYYIAPPTKEGGYIFVTALPRYAFLNAVKGNLNNYFSLLMLLLLLCFGIVIWSARITRKPLAAVTEEARQLTLLNFDSEPLPETNISEIDDLIQALESSKNTHRNFINLGRILAEEHDHEDLQERLLLESCQMLNAVGTLIFVRDEEEQYLKPAKFFIQGTFVQLTEQRPVHRETSPFSELYRGQSVTTSIAEQYWYPEIPYIPNNVMIAIPLFDHRHQVFGAIAFLFNYRPLEQLTPIIRLMESISGSIASALLTQNLLREQKELMNAFIELLAGAIDSKSPYTGGHCLRVPRLTQELARVASEQESGHFAEFKPDEDEWEAIRIASWLHDCGKIITPEYVVDKATKLETLYDRIHEVRTRFEVLKRDVEIAALQKRLPPEQLFEVGVEIATDLARLDEEFAFVAHCNRGDNVLSEQDQARLQQIGQRSWLRTLNNRLGLSREELVRMHDKARPLPVVEPLLADRLEHLIERPQNEQLSQFQHYGFKVQVPKHLYNRGELYNLSIPRGTLTNEERYKINEHIIQTIKMLERLPFPQHLSAIPEIAAGHHERMDGAGYPRGLSGDQLSIPARIVALADIFEALTASDRPYKEAKTIGQALRIMRSMCLGGHIDPHLYNLFIESDIWQRYGEEFLTPSQLDGVDRYELLLDINSLSKDH